LGGCLLVLGLTSPALGIGFFGSVVASVAGGITMFGYRRAFGLAEPSPAAVFVGRFVDSVDDGLTMPERLNAWTYLGLFVAGYIWLLTVPLSLYVAGQGFLPQAVGLLLPAGFSLWQVRRGRYSTEDGAAYALFFLLIVLGLALTTAGFLLPDVARSHPLSAAATVPESTLLVALLAVPVAAVGLRSHDRTTAMSRLLAFGGGTLAVAGLGTDLRLAEQGIRSTARFSTPWLADCLYVVGLFVALTALVFVVSAEPRRPEPDGEPTGLRK
jgi:hypothetical protein